MLVGGLIGGVGKFHVTDDFAEMASADAYFIAGPVLGEFSLGSRLVADLTLGEWMIRVVANLGAEIERHRQPRLATLEQVPVASVRLRRRPEPARDSSA